MPIGFVLDQVVRESAKQAIADWTFTAVRKRSTASIAADWLFDKIFGTKILSFRSMSFSVIISLISFVFVFIIAYATSDAKTQAEMWPFDKDVSVLELFIAIIFVIVIFVSDFVSYAQTRIFNKVIAGSSNSAVTAVLVIGDIFSTISIFAAFFSLARVLSYILVLSFSASQSKEHHSRVYPELLNGAIGREKILSDFGADDKRPAFNVVRRISEIGVSESAVPLREISKDWKAYHFGGYKLADKYKFITYSAKYECVNSKKEFGPLGMSAYDAYSNTFMVYSYAEVMRNPAITDGPAGELEDKFKSEYEKLYRASNVNCLAKVVDISSKINWKSMIGSLSFLDLYLSALNKTLVEAFSAISFKLSGYITVDPFSSDLNNFVAGAWMSSGTRLLGVGGYNDESILMANVINQYDLDGNGSVKIPLSSLMASSLSASVLLWVTLTAVFLSRLTSILTGVFVWAFPRMDIPKYIFSCITVSLVLLSFSLIGIVELWGVLWKAIFH